jgi:DNA-binding beta-propeller fold protein YncE
MSVGFGVVVASVVGLAGTAGFGQPIPVLSQLETGPYVNFDSPPVKPLAVREDGGLLLAVNTPANWLEVFDSSAMNGELHLVHRIPTGLEPVSVFFEPGTDNRFAWVLNFISDDITVVDVVLGTVVGVIPVGDEPVNVVFDPEGEFGFVITQGPAGMTLAADQVDPRGAMTVVRVHTRTVEAALQLDCGVPRAAVYDRPTRRVIVAAMQSGNGTSLVGHPIEFTDAGGPQMLLSLHFLRSFSLTSGLFGGSEFGPWPDAGAALVAPPRVARISSAGGADWEAMVDAFTHPDGSLDAGAVALFAVEFGCTPVEAHRVLGLIRDERLDPVDHDLLVVNVADATAPVVTGVTRGVGTTLAAMAFSPVTERLLVTNMEARNATRHESSLRGRFMRHEVVSMALPDEAGQVGEVVHADLHASVPNFDDASVVNPEAQARSLANPTDIVADPVKPVAYVAALGTDRVATVDAASGAVLALTDVGRGPRGLAVDGAGQRLYSLNRTDQTVTVLDVSEVAPVVLGTRRLWTPEPREVAEGRDFVFTARLSNNFSSSCAMCHLDGGIDGLAWDLGNPHGTEMLPVPLGPAAFTNHPLKGPMVTQSLRGLRGHEPFHWRGDRHSLEDFAPTFDELLGGETLGAGATAKMKEYVMSLVYPPNPFYERDNKPITPRITQGFAVFQQACVGCHDMEHDGASRPIGGTLDVGTDISFLASQVMEFTQLRGVHKKFYQERYSGFGLLHDGRQGMGALDDPLAEMMMGAFFGAIALDGCPGNHPEADAVNTSFFLRAFPTNVMPVVGWQVPVPPGVGGVELAALNSAVVRMALEHVGVPSRCDVVARGRLGGQERGFVMLTPAPGVMDPTTIVFADDAGGTVTLQGLIAGVQGGDGLSFLAVPPGSGHRIGIDMDNDGCLNQLDPFPELTADWTGDQAVDGDDVIAFFADWDGGDGDFNRDGATDGDDVIAFFAVWDLGC